MMVRDEMTSRERWLAALDLKPVDRLPFWPKILGSYPRAQAEPYRSMSISQLNRHWGADEHLFVSDWLQAVRPHCSVEVTDTAGVRRTTITTPRGVMVGEDHFDVPSQSWHPVIFPVKNLTDIGLMTEFYADTTYKVDRERLTATCDQVQRAGEATCTAVAIAKSPLMTWLEQTADIANGHFLLADYRAQVEELFQAYHRSVLCRAQLIAETTPTDVVYMMENTSTTLISPEQYDRYCLPYITQYARMAQRAGRRMLLHMCGLLKGLLPVLATLPVTGFEAFTSPPLGNTRLVDGRTACPDKALVGGTNAVLWTRPAADIIAKLEADLDCLPHHRGLVITASGVMPPMVQPDTIQAVCDWVKAYPARL